MVVTDLIRNLRNDDFQINFLHIRFLVIQIEFFFNLKCNFKFLHLIYSLNSIVFILKTLSFSVPKFLLVSFSLILLFFVGYIYFLFIYLKLFINFVLVCLRTILRIRFFLLNSYIFLCPKTIAFLNLTYCSNLLVWNQFA